MGAPLVAQGRRPFQLSRAAAHPASATSRATAPAGPAAPDTSQIPRYLFLGGWAPGGFSYCHNWRDSKAPHKGLHSGLRPGPGRRWGPLVASQGHRGTPLLCLFFSRAARTEGLRLSALLGWQLPFCTVAPRSSGAALQGVCSPPGL
ncbi:hypothetical protein NDU88_003171 [Pleurodeles waltl]|uniref:Uncharacterized protein n=1 Tax=Pleurodeles waltl TaxID=8319 RepID=A0AAV7RFI0_PLEWA|nr:hypothetical protein NDU88_003171 [Pleurodeles waltl]